MTIDRINKQADTEWDKLDKVLGDFAGLVDEIGGLLSFVDVQGPKPVHTDTLFNLLSDLEEAFSRGSEAHESLLSLQGKMEDEHNNPHCPDCGEHEEVRTGVDTEGPHQCT